MALVFSNKIALFLIIKIRIKLILIFMKEPNINLRYLTLAIKSEKQSEGWFLLYEIELKGKFSRTSLLCGQNCENCLRCGPQNALYTPLG
jgi:hypothetical protein